MEDDTFNYSGLFMGQSSCDTEAPISMKKVIETLEAFKIRTSFEV